MALDSQTCIGWAAPVVALPATGVGRVGVTPDVRQPPAPAAISRSGTPQMPAAVLCVFVAADCPSSLRAVQQALGLRSPVGAIAERSAQEGRDAGFALRRTGQQCTVDVPRGAHGDRP